jgi:hypothetical protein
MSGMYQVLQIERVGSRSHRVKMYVMTRPDDPSRYLEYFNDLVNDFAFHHGAHVKVSLDVEFAPFRESSYVTFVVKFWKHPEKHRTLLDLMGVKPKKQGNPYSFSSR